MAESIVRNDLFEESIELAGSSEYSNVVISFTNTNLPGDVELVVQQVGIQANRPVGQLWTLSDPRKFYYIPQRATYGASMVNVAGPASSLAAFIQTYGDLNSAAENTINIAASGNINATLSFCIVTSYSTAMSVQTLLISENVQMMVGSANIEENTD